MRDKNIAIFEETLNICKFGSYKLGSEMVSLKLSHDDMAQAIALAPDMSQRIMDNAMNIGTDRAFVMGRTGVYMENRDSFEVAKDIIPSYDREFGNPILIGVRCRWD